MDDEHDIRERNAKVVMELVGEPHVNIVPSYAQECFIKFLENLKNVGEYEVMALIMLIIVDGTPVDSNANDNIAEYQVFDKNEVNIFSETFVIKKQCLAMVTQKLLRIDKSIKEEKAKIVDAAKTFSNPRNAAVIENFLQSLN